MQESSRELGETNPAGDGRVADYEKLQPYRVLAGGLSW